MARKLTAIVDGTLVSGRYTYETSRMAEIELTHEGLPRLRCSWLTTASSSHQGRCTVTQTPVRPAAQLAMLYRVARHLVDHEQQVVESFRALEVAIARTLADGSLPDGLFVALESAQRLLVVDGSVTELDHRDRLVDMRVGHGSYHQRAAALKRHWSRSLFHEHLDEDLQEQLVARIKRRRAELLESPTARYKTPGSLKRRGPAAIMRQAFLLMLELSPR